MTPKEKALDLVRSFKPMMFCYMGSGMLSNEYDVDVAVNNAKRCAEIACGQLVAAAQWAAHVPNAPEIETAEYWLKVQSAISNITSNNV
jgi:hypothetical protein